jgi:excinuclease ABC subunit B
VIVCTVSAIYGIGDPVRLPQHDPAPAREREDDAARRDHHAADADAVRPQRHRVQARRVPRARRRHRHLPGGTRRTAIRVELFDDVVETLHLFDPLTGQVLQKVARFTVFPSSHYVTPRATTLRAIEQIKVELRERLEWYYANGKLVEAQRWSSAPASISR